MEPIKTATKWLCEPNYQHYTILDPDGWDRRPKFWEESWNELLTEEEFQNRLFQSTVLVKN